MTRDDIKATIVDALTRIAPEIDPASIGPSASFREQLDLDSMDFLNLVLALNERLGIEIPESDYGRLSSLDDATAYMFAKLDKNTGPSLGGTAKGTS